MAKADMNAPYSLDIANSADWDDEYWLVYVRDRLIKMRNKRAPFDKMWDEFETQINSESFYDNNWQLQVNMPLEKTLGEIYMWRTNWKATFDIVPDWQANVEELQPTKYAMNFFLDWNWKDTFWKENKAMRENKWQKGSWIFFTWPRNYKDFRYQVKKDAQIEWDTDLLNEKSFEKIMNETWFFFPKSIHPKDFFVDDNAYGQPDVQYADDCIYKERLTATEFNNRYSKNPNFINTELVTYWADINPKNKDDRAIDVRHVIVYHYYHRITKKYIIMTNEANIIFNWLFLYNDWKLPFENIQHYSNINRFWGEWIPERIGYLKIYRSEILQDILAWAEMSSWVHIIAWNDDQIGQDWQLWGRGLNIWRTTGGADKVQQMNTSPNLWYFTSVLELLDKLVVSDSWINPLAQFESWAATLWQEELIEANKSVRNSSVDENYNIGLDWALTMMLDRIKQFAPALLKETIKGKDWKVLKEIFPKIRIDNVQVEKKWGKTVFTESIGKYGYFELKPDVVQWIGVKITTASTNSVLPILERQKITEFLNNVTSLANVAALDQTWQSTKKVMEFLRLDELVEWMWDAYGYDINWLKASSEKDKIAKENIKKLNQIKEMLTSNQPTNDSWTMGATNPQEWANWAQSPVWWAPAGVPSLWAPNQVPAQSWSISSPANQGIWWWNTAL